LTEAPSPASNPPSTSEEECARARPSPSLLAAPPARAQDAQLLSDVDAVEKVMQEPGILQRYPHDPEELPAR
jgi:hypothetical protein